MSEKLFKDGRLRIRLDCICGSALETSGSDHEYVRQFARWFEEEHSGKEGHALCSVAESAKARRREQRERLKKHREWVRSGAP